MQKSCFVVLLVLQFAGCLAHREDFMTSDDMRSQMLFNPVVRRRAYWEAPSDDGSQLDKRTIRPEYSNPCDVVTKRVQLNDGVHKFWPSSYTEMTCRNGVDTSDERTYIDFSKPPQTCGAESLVCVQRYDEIVILKTVPGRWPECWQLETKWREVVRVPSGCDCLQSDHFIDRLVAKSP